MAIETQPQQHPRQQPLHTGLSVVVIATILIALTNVSVPLTYEAGLNAFTLQFLRFTAFLLLVGGYLRMMGIGIGIAVKDRLHCLGAGLFYCSGANGLLISMAYLPVSLAVLILFTFPLITQAMESVLDRRWPSGLTVLCLGMALTGLGIALGVGFEDLKPFGVLCAFYAAFGVATSFVWTGRKAPHVHSVVVTFYIAISGVSLAIIAVTVGGQWQMPVLDFANSALFAGAIVSFGGAFMAMFIGVGLIGAARTAMVMNLEPVFTIALAWALLSENLTALQLFGASLVIAAVVVSQLQSNRQ